MFAKIVRKALILLAVYFVVIIGIFIVQFKNDSIISEKFGSLHITLLESADEKNTTTLKNRFSVSYNGISIFANDDKPVYLVSDASSKPLTLVSWKKDSELSFTLNFSQNTRLRFAVSDDSPKAILTVQARIPEGYKNLSVPYSLTAGSSISSMNPSLLQVHNKKNSWEFASEDIDRDSFVLSPKVSVASYSNVNKSQTFSFADTLALDTNSETMLSNYSENLKNALISSFDQIPQDSQNVIEQEAVSFVAAMAERGKYNEALDAVPQSFRKSSSRTYLSAPYFNNLVKTNETLVRQMQSYSDMISAAISAGTFEVFTVRNIADYMCFHPGSEQIKSLLSKTASADFNAITVAQAAGILSVYDELYTKNSNLAGILSNAVPKALSKIQSNCFLDGNKIIISENGTFLSVLNAASVGDALLRYGQLTAHKDEEAAGRVILNSYLKDVSSFDLRALSELYPVIVHNNSFYPHYEMMGFDNGSAVWAWTCASSIKYSNESGQITLLIDFPLSFTHYLIINGIPSFKSIYIYDMAFRTDPRFETYNSSGYVYQRDSQTLLLKSRHRSQLETVRLILNDEAASNSQAIKATDAATGKEVKEEPAETPSEQ